MGVGDFGGQDGLFGGAVGVVGEVGAEGGDAHGGAVAEGAFAVEEFAGRLVPVVALPDAVEEFEGAGAVAAFDGHVFGECVGEVVLVDLPGLV
ncbi:hypothetical protein BJF79_33240 [Actinomadura sp. CNU-125]|nr:hypothetical protein BJF79_33240 [Actinomadura sp. CNU-125]